MELFEYGMFECQWPKFNLTSNKYDCSLFREIDNRIPDWIDSALILQVEDGDYYGSGKWIGVQGKIMVYCNWISKPMAPQEKSRC